MQACDSLQVLSLARNPLEDEALFILADALLHATLLRRLDLSDTRCRRRGWSALVACLCRLPLLQALLASGNQLPDGPSAAAAAAAAAGGGSVSVEVPVGLLEYFP